MHDIFLICEIFQRNKLRRTENLCKENYKSASSPLRSSRFNSFWAVPEGRLPPCSHFWTEWMLALRTEARTAWLIFRRERRARIASGVYSGTPHSRHIASKCRMVALSTPPMPYRSAMASCTDASASLLGFIFISNTHV